MARDLNLNRIDIPNNLSNFINGNLIDPVAIQQSAPYLQNGLTYVSNNTSIHPRDESGNIILQENSETNPLLIIEPTTINYTVQSTNRVLNTAFQYFKFPVISSVVPDIISDLDINLDTTSLSYDPLFARYKPTDDGAVQVDITGTSFSGIDMSEVVEGLPQTNTNCYTITKEVKNSGKDLLFRIKITHQFSSTVDSVGTVYFSLIKTGPNYPLNRQWRGSFASTRPTTTVDFNALIRDIAVTMRDICDDPAKLGGQYFTINYEEPWITYYRYFTISPYPNPGVLPDQTRLTGNQLEAINFVKTRDRKKVPRTSESTYNNLLAQLETKLNEYNQAVNTVNDVWGFINNGTSQTVYINEVIPNSEFEIGDIFQIGALAGMEGHTILNNQSYWVISDASKNVDVWNQEIVE